MTAKTAIVIPARMEAARFPGKPLADICGKPMIVHVMERAQAADMGDVFVACAEEEIAAAIRKAGGTAVLTNPAHPSGTDRIYEAVTKIGKEYQYIVNVQGDLPALDPAMIETAVQVLKHNTKVDIATLAAVITDPAERTNPNVVKAVLSFIESPTVGRALYFTRATAPTGEGDLYHHIGLYAYRRSVLEKFVSLKPSPLEKREKLEQLRAIEHGMRIDVAVVDNVPLGVDTPEDLQKVVAKMSN